MSSKSTFMTSLLRLSWITASALGLSWRITVANYRMGRRKYKGQKTSQDWQKQHATGRLVGALIQAAQPKPTKLKVHWSNRKSLKRWGEAMARQGSQGPIWALRFPWHRPIASGQSLSWGDGMWGHLFTPRDTGADSSVWLLCLIAPVGNPSA